MIPKIEITDIGYNSPTTSEINSGTWTMLDNSMGGNLSRVQGTPQYQLSTSITAMVKDAYDQNIQLANQFDPRYASGIYQDAIGELYFMARKLATNSICPVVFKGLSGAPIPEGFIVQDTSGRNWRTTGPYNIGSSGTVTISCVCDVAGAIEALPNSITVIPVALSNLDEVYNEESAIMGYDEENRIDFEVRRRESVAINAKMTDTATLGAVLDVRNVVDAYVISNPTDTTVVKGETNYSLIRNSIVVSVVGGTDSEVAKAAFIKAGTGCSWNGNTDVTVVADGFDVSPPTYPIKILRPDFLEVFIKIVVQNKSSVTFTSETEAKNHIIDSSTSGDNRFRIAKNIIPTNFVVGMPNIGLKGIYISTDGATWLDELPVGIDQFPVINAFRISIEES